MHLFAKVLPRQGSQGAVQPLPGTNSAPSSVLILTQTPTSTTSSPTNTAPSPPSSASATPSSTPNQGDGSKPTYIIAIIAVVAFLLLLFAVFIILRRTRRKHKNPKYVPTPFLKKLWQKWDPNPQRWRLPDNTNTHLESTRSAGGLSVPPSFDTAARSAVETTNNANGSGAAGGVDRNTSVRSVMTLPAYHQSARQNEQVLAREGERGGIDVVIEFPETVDEEEMRREEEMEALYQVRLARRRENEEREERRRLRREARERGDYVALREIQARARASSSASAGRSVEELRAEHDRIKKERQRVVSSVSYADLGVARHDGTRLRANSEESERTGLLGDAASIAASSHYHRRDRSASSVLSIDTMNSDLPSPGLTRSRGNSRASRPESPLRRMSVQSQTEGTSTENGRAGSSPEIIEHEDFPPHSPPGYENISLDTPRDEHPHHAEPPPDYASPVMARGGQFPAIESDITNMERTDTSSTGRTSATHVAQLMADRRTSSSGSGDLAAARNPMGDRRTSRGVGGIPQLPSLRLASLPSIQVDPGSPAVGRIEEERGIPPQP